MASEYLPHFAAYACHNLLQSDTISLKAQREKGWSRLAPAIRGPLELAHNRPGFAATAHQLHTSAPCLCLAKVPKTLIAFYCSIQHCTSLYRIYLLQFMNTFGSISAVTAEVPTTSVWSLQFRSICPSKKRQTNGTCWGSPKCISRLASTLIRRVRPSWSVWVMDYGRPSAKSFCLTQVRIETVHSQKIIHRLTID